MSKYIEQFLANLKAQTAPPKEETDKKKMRIINSWLKNETPQYKRYRDKGGSNLQYLAHMFAKAGIDKAAAWEFAKEELGGWYDQTSQDDMKTEFDIEFDSTSEDAAWSDRVFGFLSK